MTIRYTDRAAFRDDLGIALMDYNIDESGYIADKVLPVVDKAMKAASYGIISSKNNRATNNKASNGGQLNMIETEAEDRSYNCLRYGLGHPITDEDRANYKTIFDAEVVAAQLVRTNMLNQKEIRVASECFNTTTFTAGKGNYVDNSGSPWSTVSTDIISQIATAATAFRTRCGWVADTLTIGYGTLQNLLKNTGIINRFPGAVVITPQMIYNEMASLFGLRNMYVGTQTYNTAVVGGTETHSDIWSNSYALLSKQSTSDMMPGLGWQFNWTGNGDIKIGFSSYRDESRSSNIVQEQEYRDEVIEGSGKYGYLIKIG